MSRCLKIDERAKTLLNVLLHAQTLMDTSALSGYGHWQLGNLHQSREAAGKIEATRKKKKITRHYTRKPSSKVHFLYLHPHDSSWVSSTTYSNSQDYNAVLLTDRTTKNFQADQSSTNPPQIQAKKSVMSWYFHFPLLSPSLLPKKLLSQLKNILVLF